MLYMWYTCGIHVVYMWYTSGLWKYVVFMIRAGFRVSQISIGVLCLVVVWGGFQMHAVYHNFNYTEIHDFLSLPSPVKLLESFTQLQNLI